jgi:outer membrane protein OmpA-like peptidoglycan-associated protein
VPDNSEIRVNGSPFEVTSGDGSYRLIGLKGGQIKTIDIVAPAGWNCESFTVVGEDGQDVPKIAPCRQTSTPPVVPTIKAGCDPSTFTKNDIAKSHACAYEKLNELKDPFTVQDLLTAMNLYIINFASGKYNINAEDMKFLEKSAGYMKKLPPEIKVEVGGHTDNTGKDNQKLSENRANAVRDALIGFGVNKDVLTMQGYADRNPVDDNKTEDGKFRNRRIAYRQG